MAELRDEPKVDTSAEPKLAETETKLATNPIQGDAAKEVPAKDDSTTEPVCLDSLAPL